MHVAFLLGISPGVQVITLSQEYVRGQWFSGRLAGIAMFRVNVHLTFIGLELRFGQRKAE